MDSNEYESHTRQCPNCGDVAPEEADWRASTNQHPCVNSDCRIISFLEEPRNANKYLKESHE